MWVSQDPLHYCCKTFFTIILHLHGQNSTKNYVKFIFFKVTTTIGVFIIVDFTGSISLMLILWIYYFTFRRPKLNRQEIKFQLFFRSPQMTMEIAISLIKHISGRRNCVAQPRPSVPYFHRFVFKDFTCNDTWHFVSKHFLNFNMVMHSIFHFERKWSFNL